MHYEKKKRFQTDRCNICGKVAELTWDHVPPKSCYNRRAVECNPIYKNDLDKRYEKKFQNGIRYRTLCSKCNNELLGAIYDPELQKLTMEVDKLMRLRTPPLVNYECKINKIVRAVCGHMLAAMEQYPDGVIFEELREFVCDETVLPPPGRKLLFRIYPFSTVVINQGFYIKNLNKINRNTYFPRGVCSMISSYPIAYIFSEKEMNSELIDLFEYCTNNITDNVTIPIDFSSCFYKDTSILRHFLWPCNIGDDKYSADMMLTGNKSIIGVRREGL